MVDFGKPVLRWSEPRTYYRALRMQARQDDIKSYVQENLILPFLLGFFFGWVFSIGMTGGQMMMKEHLLSSIAYGMLFGLSCLAIHTVDRLVRPTISFKDRKIVRKTGHLVERFPLEGIDRYTFENRNVENQSYRCLILFMPKRIVPFTTLVLNDSVDEQKLVDFFMEKKIRRVDGITSEEIVSAIEANLPEERV